MKLELEAVCQIVNVNAAVVNSLFFFLSLSLCSSHSPEETQSPSAGMAASGSDKVFSGGARPPCPSRPVPRIVMAVLLTVRFKRCFAVLPFLPMPSRLW